jgi:hypothetical protein
VRAAGHKVHDVPGQFDVTSRHSISVAGRIEFPMELHGVILFLSTRKPTDVELKQYDDGHLQSVELTENIPWEPDSTRFAESEKAARAAPSVSAVRVTIPRPKVSDIRSEEEEERAYHRFQRPTILEERELKVASRLDASNSPIELADEDQLAARVVAVVNVGSECEMDSGGSPSCDVECAKKGCRYTAKIATRDQRSVITNPGEAMGHWVGYRSLNSNSDHTNRHQESLESCREAIQDQRGTPPFPNTQYAYVHRHHVRSFKVAPREQVRPGLHQWRRL